MDREPEFVVDVMTEHPVVVGPDMPAWSADCLARTRNVHYLLVVDAYRLVGVVCGCDLEHAGADASVGSCMCDHPVTVDDQATAEAAAARMRSRRVGCLPVVDWSGALRGVVTRHDLRASGALPDRAVRCESCGSTHGLPFTDATQDTPVFCTRCAEDAAQPRNTIDEAYITLGGGD